ncbi:hypothetical protein Dda_2180 [Drechslerella dactyloides]|uniref:Uncharacterized protein n=1 Tax=Drechslerella dactyloides TaxID=74499 RepID=A0AAD6J4E8_DREDA|nr:hypothetical protein Dda_2180 [Drechslerella dactyloides]
MANPAETLQKLIRENVSTAALFVNAVDFELGRMNTKIPCGPRSIFGRALEAMTQDAIELARKHLPWLTINITHNAHVSKIDLTDPVRPILTIEDTETRILSNKSYNLLIKATGATWKVPVSGSVQSNAYTDIPSAKSVTKYLFERDILHLDGFIAPGKKLFIGGASLSAYDFVGIILARTKIISLETRGNTRELVINEDEAKRYPHLIKFFNRKDGEICAPRHADGMDAKMPEGFDFITPEMLLSAQMRKKCNRLPMISELCRIVTAIALDKSPADIEPDLPTEEQFDRMTAENEKFAANPQTITETSMIRRCLISFAWTNTTSPKISEQRATLCESYPLLMREPWHASRSLHYHVTDYQDSETAQAPVPQHLSAQAFRKFWNHITTSAPFEIHLLITRLYKLGVISWTRGAYEDVVWSSKKTKFLLNDESADGLIAPRVLTETTDALSADILKQTMTSKTTARKAVYQKCRTLLSPSGQTVHVMELGLPGHGGITDGILIRRAQWLDTNSYESAQQLMPGVVDIVGIIEGMISQGISRPFDLLQKYYETVLPKRQDFARQINKLKMPYHQLTEFLKYARLVEEAYPGQFAEKMRQGIDIGNRRRIIAEIKQTRGCHSSLKRAWAAFDRDCASDRFIPVSLRSFEKMTPDFSRDQIKKIKDIWARASNHLKSTTTKPHRNHQQIDQGTLKMISQARTKPAPISFNSIQRIPEDTKYEITTTTRVLMEGEEDEEEEKVAVMVV